jgi:hypothetical protein
MLERATCICVYCFMVTWFVQTSYSIEDQMFGCLCTSNLHYGLLCSLICVYQYFRGIWCLHLYKMEVVGAYEVLVYYLADCTVS